MAALIIMSLLSSTNAGSTTNDYFVRNIGGSGDGAAAVPCIKGGDALGLIRIGQAPDSGIIIGGDDATDISRVRGGAAAGSSLLLGASATSYQNIALTDGVTTISGLLSVPGSISGYYVASVAVGAGGGVMANPAGLTSGLYSVIYVGTGAGNELAEPSGLFYWNNVSWSGNSVSAAISAGGVPNTAIYPTAGGATLSVGGGAIPAGNAVFRKMMN